MQTEKERRRQANTELQQDLKRQMEIRQSKQSKEVEQRRENYATNGGPGLTHEQYSVSRKLTADQNRVV